jgi:mRNA-degrading endonuclease RelE of RelBE toxin-antitoxin system
MPCEIRIKKSTEKNLRKLPENVQDRFGNLVEVLRLSGPSGAHIFQNYGKLGENEYHCHLTFHYVACWRHEKATITIEVYYAGNREDAPY